MLPPTARKAHIFPRLAQISLILIKYYVMQVARSYLTKSTAEFIITTNYF